MSGVVVWGWLALAMIEGATVVVLVDVVVVVVVVVNAGALLVLAAPRVMAPPLWAPPLWFCIKLGVASSSS